MAMTPLEMTSEDSESEEEDYKISTTYERRWGLLALVTLLEFNVGLQFSYYTAVNRTVQRYFDLPLQSIEYLTISSIIVAFIFILPCVWVMNKTSLRTSCLINTLLATVASLMKYFATTPSTVGYIVTLLGQILSSLAACFAVTLPPEFAAVWFNADQRAIATSSGTMGHFIGYGTAYVLATLLIADKTDPASIEWGIKSGLMLQFTVSLLFLIACYVAFENEPPTAPSRSQHLLDTRELRPTYVQAVQLITAKNVRFVLFSTGCGIVFGGVYCQWQVIQEALPGVFKGKEYAVGMLGGLSAFLSIPSAIVSGIWLDKTKSYRYSIEVVSFLTVLLSISVTLVMHFDGSMTSLYITFASQAVISTAVVAMSFVLASEMTYPVPETISTAILYMASQTTALMLAIGTSLIYQKTTNAVTANVVLNGAFLLAFILITVGNTEYKRYAQDKK